ncbi:NIPSNAP family protein [bacterium]|nr:NIPSNAP family protein [bacterium]
MMQRTRWMGAIGLGLLMAAGAARAGAAAPKQVLELRLYSVEAGEKRQRLDEFLGKVAIPAWNRIGIRPVGVWEAADGKRADLYVLLPHASMAAFATSRQRLLADAEFQKAGEPFLTLPKSDPLYRRIESTLMLAFDDCPKVEDAVKDDTRLFQLRIYESHSLLKGQRKVEMFNTGGEIALFRQCGMQPVFFGETLVGTRIPNLTYMLVFKDEAAQKANWKKFVTSPEWKAMSGKPIYKDTVSRITNIILKPTACSQL